ncbi:MAG TPA: hypothetical protein VFL76_03360 [Edaphocola sp.]|nr:hypothetical protein [Edaphocola sp.]
MSGSVSPAIGYWHGLPQGKNKNGGNRGGPEGQPLFPLNKKPSLKPVANA